MLGNVKDINDRPQKPKPKVKPVSTGFLKPGDIDPNMKIIIDKLFDKLYGNEKYKLKN